MFQLIFPVVSFPLRPVRATCASPTGTGRMASIPETIDAGFPRRVSLTARLKTLSQNETGFYAAMMIDSETKNVSALRRTCLHRRPR